MLRFLPTPLALTLPLLGLLLPCHLAAQEGTDLSTEGWNSPSALELVERGRLARGRLASEGDLESYRTTVEGSIYFYLDSDEGEGALIRVDQVAVEVQWRAPDRVQQHIVGERSETRLPVQDFRYYIDRITLVHYGFDDEIRIGQGRDVAGVPHPLAALPPETPLPYDFRLTDSISLNFPGRESPLRLQTLEVRPRDAERPGIFGTLTLEAETAQIVRMAITFTPASYVDPRTDRISAELDYGLWEGRYWLPNLQRIEVRREIPEIDIGVGTVIRSVLRAGDYELNAPLAPNFAILPSVTSLPPAERREYPFTQGLYDGLSRDGLAEIRVESSLAELRTEAIRRIRESAPSGLSPLRLHIPGFSSLLRYSRAEGSVLGVGGTFTPAAGVRIRGHLAGAPETGEVQSRGELQIPLPSGWNAVLEGRYRTLSDLGVAQGAPGILSSLSALVRGEDYLDPYRTSGVSAGLHFPVGESSSGWVRAGFERHSNAALARESAPLNGSRTFRPIRPVAEGDFAVAEAGVEGGIPLPFEGRGWAELTSGILHGDPGAGGHLSLEVTGQWGPLSGERELRGDLRSWSWWGDSLPQGERLLGGRGTLPGYRYRSFSGRRVLRGSIEGALDLMGPHLRLRGGLHTGWSDGDPPVGWETEPTGGIRSSATLGIGVGWDLLRLDLARGFDGGEWQWIFSIDPGWWDRL